ncbi:MAG: hypothetical protein R3A51_13670 [Nannocystaceae bacterium]|nr:hypothetical protein [Myxococcales bacterium]
MRDGAPPWCTAPTLAQSEEVRVGDASLWVERWSGGTRLRVRGVREDDAAWREDQQEVVLSIDEVAALRECLETGRDVARVVEAWGRRYRTTWSLDPPSELWEVGAYLWRYPMSEARMTLRIAAAPLRAALAGPLARWLQG